jgi:Na+-driven multidrug efflux pump
MIAVWVGLSTGLTSNLARAMGAKDEARIQQALATTWRLVLWVVPVFAALGGLCWVLAPRIAGSEALARPFAIYSAVMLVGSAATTFWSIVPDSLVKAHHDTRATMWRSGPTHQRRPQHDLHLALSTGISDRASTGSAASAGWPRAAPRRLA